MTIFILKFLKGFVFTNQLLKYSLSRSTIIMKFLTSLNGLTNEHLNLLWKACENKHEATVRVVFEAIIEISNYLTIDVICIFN